MNLGKDARAFADELSDLLNNTVTTGIRLTLLLIRGVAYIGYRITVDDVETKGVPIRIRGGAPAGYLGISYRLAPDPEGHFLMVRSSVLGIYADEHLDIPLIHYDYERDKPDGYPDAHMQVPAESPAWEILRPPALADRPLEKLHFPVGGRRYRPSLEEVIEFLVVEMGVSCRDNWEERVLKGRRGFEERQLRAAIRRNPAIALDQLRKMGKIS